MSPVARVRTRLLLTALVCALLVALVPARPEVAARRASQSPPGSRQPLHRLTAPRVSPLPEAQWTDAHRSLVAAYAPDGDPGNGFRTLLHVPELVEALYPFVNYISYDSSLPARHREILIFRTAWLCQSAYLWADHAAGASSAGLTTTDLRRIAEGADARGWDPFEATLVGLADELFRNSSVTDATWNTLADRYDLYQMVDAVMTVAELTKLSMMFNAMGVQPDDGATEHLPSDIPYRVVVPEREPALTSPRIEPVEGRGLRVLRTFDRHPKVAETWNYSYVLNTSPLVPHDRELLILRIGWNCQAEYEWAKHVGSVGRAREHGLEPRWIAEGPDAPGWDRNGAALLTATDELYRDAIVSDGTWDTLAARYDRREMMSILMTVGSYQMLSMALNAFGVQLLPDDERFPAIERP